jgi:sialate O-acetylesterase
MKTIVNISLTALFMMCAITSNAAAQNLRMPKVFGDHMVLQREIPVRMWGRAEANKKVSVKIDGLTVNTQSDRSGNWETLFPSQLAGGPFQVTVRSSGDTIRYKDVYFGDVWLAGGQSNMEWKIGWKINNLEAEIQDSDYPAIRFLEVPNELSSAPVSDISAAKWTTAGPATVNDISAVAWFFAKHNHLEKNVAVGIIDSNWGGTPAETWFDANRVRAVPGYKKQAEKVLDSSINWQQKIAENNANEQLKWKLLGDTEAVIKIGSNLHKYEDKNWQAVKLPNTRPLSDFAWLKKTVRMDFPVNTTAQLNLGDLVQEAMIFLNGKLIAIESWQDNSSLHEIPASAFLQGDNLITMRVANSWDNNVVAGKQGEMWLAAGDKKINLEGEWLYTNDIEQKMPVVERYNWQPGFLFNAMIRPIAGYSIRGVIWYQGESNDDKPHWYADLFKALIDDWRINWKQERLPFLFVQLANYMERKAVQPDSNWASIREAQAAALDLPDTGMAVTIDIGVAEDVHPRNKQDVGKRLWLNARKIVFGDNLVYSGPVYHQHKVEGNKIVVSFEHIGGGLVAAEDGRVNGFTVAGADKSFYLATAEINGDKVIVSSNKVNQPVAVRYGWANNPDVNLYNREGLPAAPFRTDNW